ncbi:MAG: glycosyltransferase, partial [Hyphococcus sp.]
APSRQILQWATRRGIDTLPLLADSFEQKTLRSQVSAMMLGRALNAPNIRAVGNHNIPASLSLRRIGVRPEKIFPWDWPHALTPDQHPVKTHVAGDKPEIVYVGSIAIDKGVEDCIHAARILLTQGRDFSMSLIGDGPYAREAKAEIERAGLSDHVFLTGRLSHDEVVQRLKTASLSLVPSHHSYPEGLPMTIYEALATRTPLAISDHPMFQLYLKNAGAARMSPQKDAQSLAASILSLLDDAEAYQAASEATAALWHRIKCDLTWGRLIEAWLGKGGKGLESIRDHALDRQLSQLKRPATEKPPV